MRLGSDSGPSHPSDLDLFRDGMLSISVQNTDHSPACAAACESAIEEGRVGGVHGQIPYRELELLSVLE